jgi:transcription termination factor Rho
MRHVFVLSRDHPWRPWLYDYLLERFKDDGRVEVILDRRLSDRRIVASGMCPGQERRATERRRLISREDDLRVRSHYIVEL